MKKLLLKPSFEFIFSFSLVIILGLPPVLLAQNQSQKDLDIRIENGDTTINGKNIKELSAADRQSALTDINNLNTGSKNGRHKYIFKRKDTTISDNIAFNSLKNGVVRDSLGNVISVRPGKRKEIKTQMAFKYHFNDDNADRTEPGERGNRSFNRPMLRFDRKNSQNFVYVNTDNDGVSTHLSFRVSEASDDDLKRMPYVEGPKFEIKDLNLVPEFSSGKILLMFNLLSKAPAEVKLSDSEGKLIWSEKAIGGTFSKRFALGLNGIYYLQIQQGKSISVKKIMKEE